jgi:hypothetical protein
MQMQAEVLAVKVLVTPQGFAIVKVLAVVEAELYGCYASLPADYTSEDCISAVAYQLCGDCTGSYSVTVQAGTTLNLSSISTFDPDHRNRFAPGVFNRTTQHDRLMM